MTEAYDFDKAKVFSGDNLPAKKEKEKTITDLINASLPQIRAALPRHMTPERMARIALTTIKLTPKLLECTPRSLLAAIIESSQLGLEIDMRGLAFIVPYGKEATLLIGYKGLIELAIRSGKVSHIDAEVVYEDDEFDYALGLDPKLYHKPSLTRPDASQKKAVYALAKMTDGEPVFIILGQSDIERIKKSSRAKSGPWFDWEDEMWKKSAIRRLCKRLPQSPELQRAISIDEAAEAGIPQNLAAGVIDVTPEPEQKEPVTSGQIKDSPPAKLQVEDSGLNVFDPPAVAREQLGLTQLGVEEPQNEYDKNDSTPLIPATEVPGPAHTSKQWSTMHGLATAKRWTSEELHAEMCLKFNLVSASEISKAQASEIIKWLEGLPDAPPKEV